MGRLPVAAALAVLSLAGCTGSADEPGPEPPDLAPPEVGACRVLEPGDIALPSDDTPTVSCRSPHTAQTYLVDQFTGPLAQAEYDDQRLAARAYRTCAPGFRRFTGADESLALRTVLAWAWFRPSEEAWRAGARWFRCDVVGGHEDSAALVELPRTAQGVLLGIPDDRWMACVAGPKVTGATLVPCDADHTWRAVGTVVLGEKDDPWPGNRMVEVLSREYCSDWVGYWSNFQLDYHYGWTWFHRADWEMGNRRSVCWARTPD